MARKKISFYDREMVMWKFGGCCAYCGDFMSLLVVDHIVPVSKGGINEIENLNPACTLCNSTKSDLSLEDFRNKIGTAHYSEPLLRPVVLSVAYKQIVVTHHPVVFHFEKAPIATTAK